MSVGIVHLGKAMNAARFGHLEKASCMHSVSQACHVPCAGRVLMALPVVQHRRPYTYTPGHCEHVCMACRLKAGKEKRLDSKKKDSNRKKERSRRDFD